MKASIAKVITLLAHRNDIITVADKDATVWDFVEQHSNDCISPRTRFLKLSERLETALSVTHFLLWEARSVHRLVLNLSVLIRCFSRVEIKCEDRRGRNSAS